MEQQPMLGSVVSQTQVCWESLPRPSLACHCGWEAPDRPSSRCPGHMVATRPDAPRLSQLSGWTATTSLFSPASFSKAASRNQSVQAWRSVLGKACWEEGTAFESLSFPGSRWPSHHPTQPGWAAPTVLRWSRTTRPLEGCDM